MTDYYAALGVARTSKFVEIRKRYLSLVQEVHPDRYSDPEEKARRAAQFKDVGEAWAVLSDPELRRAYDLSLAGGTAFDPNAARGPRDHNAISSEVAALGFAQAVTHLPEEFAEIINSMLFSKDPASQERAISSFRITGHALRSMPVNCSRGTSDAECYAVVTNLGLVGAVRGESSAQEGNTRYTMKYTNGFRLSWSETTRMDLELDPVSGWFAATFYGHENRLSGMRLQCTGSPYPLLWLADLYDFETVIRLKHRRLPYRELTVLGTVAAMLAANAYLWQFHIPGVFQPDLAAARATFGSIPFTAGAMWLIAALLPIHLLAEGLRARRDRRVQAICDLYHRASGGN